MSQTATAHQVPAMNAAEVPFWDFKNVSAGVSGADAWNQTKATVQAASSDKHPSVDSQYAAERILVLGPALAPLRDPMLRRLSDAEVVEIALAFDSLPRLAHALLYVNAQVALEPSKDISFKDLLDDALGLRDRGLVSCEIFEKLGHVTSGTTKAIRKGRGHGDLAEDLQVLHQVLSPHQTRLAALQNLAVPGTTAITEADSARLSHVGTALKLRITQPGAAGPWYSALVNLAYLAYLTYDAAINAVHYHLRREGHRRPERDFPMFLGLRRPAAPAAAPAAPAAPASTP